MTTILCVRKGSEVVIAGDGQATLGETVIFKSKSVKVRRIGNGKIIAGFAGSNGWKASWKNMPGS